MRLVFVDTAAWIALLNQDDDLHTQAQLVMHQLQTNGTVLITSEFVLLEIADALNQREFRRKTVRFISSLRQMESLQIVGISRDLLDAGWELYRQRLDKAWGLTDCTSFVVMQQKSISMAFTSDKHFEQAGFIRLMQP